MALNNSRSLRYSRLLRYATRVEDTSHGEGDSHIKVTGVIVVPFSLLWVKIRGLVPLMVLKSKMTSVGGMVVPFRVLSQNI